MDKKKQKKLLITFCVFLLLWNFPLISLFESEKSGSASMWVLVSMFFSWFIFIVVLWRIVSLYMSNNSKTDTNE